MSIPVKDIKLLWSKAAGYCSMPECRKPLIHEAPVDSTVSNVLIGEMAHIVGEKNSSTSPRGISSLSEEERNGYKNLILLCRNHHKIIDEDITTWTIEKLHITKRSHELWVEERLGRCIDDEIQVYHDFIDRVAIALRFEHWETTCDALFRLIMPADFPDGLYQLNFEYFRAILPGKEPNFEAELKNIVSRSRSYLDHYMSNAEGVPGDPRIMGKKLYRNEKDIQRHARLLQEYNKWERNCTMLLSNLVYAMNSFSDVVRSNLRPGFFVRKGKFCVHDFLGSMSEDFGTETWYIPEDYYTDDDLNAPYKRCSDEPNQIVNGESVPNLD